MSFIDNLRNAPGNFVDFGSKAVDEAQDFGSGAVNRAQDLGEAVLPVAVDAWRFQADVTRAGLERSFDFSRNAAEFGLDKLGDGFDKGGEIVGNGVDWAQNRIDAASHPGDPNPPASQGLTFAETKSASDLAYAKHDLKAGDVYKFQPNNKEWRVAEISTNPETGFRAVALQPVDPNDNRTVLAFSGSDEGVDWVNNFQQGAGLASAQYGEAVDFANKWKGNDDAGEVILTGHSLGGGLASYASIKTDLPATAVNSAPITLNHLGFNPADAFRITQYYVPGEALSVVNEGNPLDVRPGFSIAVEGKDSIIDPRSVASNHSLDNVAPDIGAPEKK